ncbi:MAG: hypothetical protein LUI12_07495 [Clostridiales bacterium]|nr:hypothetical protein [Clostridiales bacterium]
MGKEVARGGRCQFCVCVCIRGVWFPAVVVGTYAFLTIQLEDTTIMQFIRYACAYFISEQQHYEWMYTPDE